jgi:hypothetical protein
MATINVSNADQLKSAMATAKAGDTILLASGNYGDFATSNDYTSAVTIKSANPGSPASFSSVSLNGATGITFDSVKLDYSFKSGGSVDANPFEVVNSSNITFRNSTFDGDVAKGLGAPSDGYAAGRGLAIIGSKGVTVEGSEFKTFMRGILAIESQDIKIIDNDISGMRSDGLNMVQVKGVLIEDNYIHDFRAAPNSGDHGDMIQFWTAGTTSPSTDITIRGNTLDVNQGTWAQSIFMRNELVDQGKAGASMFYKNILIEDNTIKNAHTHGITVGETDGLTIQNNLIVAATLNKADPYNAEYLKAYGPTAGVMVPQIILSNTSDNVTVKDNAFSGAPHATTPRVAGAGTGPDWSITNNKYYADVNSAPATAGSSGSGGTPPVSGGGSGTPPVDPIKPPVDPIKPPVDPVKPPVDPIKPPVDPVKPPVDPIKPPVDPVKPPVDPVKPPVDPVKPPVDPVKPPSAGPHKLPTLDDFRLDPAKLTKAKLIDNAKVVTVGGEKLISLDGARDYVDLGRLKQFEAAEKITFEFDYGRDVANGQDARLLWNHSKFGVTASGDGLIVHVATAKEGFKAFNIGKLGLNDTDNHTIRVMLDQKSNQLQVLVDGKVVFNHTATDLKFVGAGGYEHGWTLGSPWDRYLDGEIGDLKVEANATFIGTSASSKPGTPSPFKGVSKAPAIKATKNTADASKDKGAADQKKSATKIAIDKDDSMSAKLAALLKMSAEKAGSAKSDTGTKTKVTLDKSGDRMNFSFDNPKNLDDDAPTKVKAASVSHSDFDHSDHGPQFLADLIADMFGDSLL